ncbi:phosphate regulon sensor histidine kinase PhoR [Halioglobus maricola]|uniref:Phosphate regulon sensor protein PhoR n=1 Tax=Halioglobus maricola TaxID=2601894 RepID=A0A5P9NJL6_9GAMM|nr:phosphate regulon sensor histidine kinase PhoR [Halioglobus maricola]QFU76073.1 phosphate regulon sensor histidine kinase PhoR [Halioglobus maricola]
MEWLASVFRLIGTVLLAALAGFYFGNPLAWALVAAVLLLVFWSLQLWRLRKWLADSSGSPPDLFGVWGDIVANIYKRQRKAIATEERLQSTVDYLLDSFAAMRDGVVILEGQGALRWCNEAAQRLLALRYPDDIGQAISNIVRVPEFAEYLSTADYSVPLVFETTGEIKHHLQLVVTQFAEGDTLLFVRDVTDVVRTESIRRDFVGNVSHELRTPLTVISGYLGTFMADPDSLPAPYVRAIEQMAGQAARMENLLKDLLWLSRIESTERQDKDDKVDIAALLDELKEEVANTHPGNPLQLDIQCRTKIPGDYRELYSAVSNLVFNAFKYSSEGEPVVASWREDGDVARLDIVDTGIGIDASHFNRLTERFYRVDDSRSSATGGTGLGLAIVKHVAAAHGAHLEIDSKLGKGSTFSLVFPEQN